jgi:hypothetical protein
MTHANRHDAERVARAGADRQSIVERLLAARRRQRRLVAAVLAVWGLLAAAVLAGQGGDGRVTTLSGLQLVNEDAEVVAFTFVDGSGYFKLQLQPVGDTSPYAWLGGAAGAAAAQVGGGRGYCDLSADRAGGTSIIVDSGKGGPWNILMYEPAKELSGVFVHGLQDMVLFKVER